MADSHLKHITEVTLATHHNSPAADIWCAVDKAVSAIFPYQLFTISVYDQASGTTCRLYTTRHDVQPLGARKQVTESTWSKHVLQDGKQFLGSSIEELKCFSEWEFLQGIGCESVLNTPIRSNETGSVVGTLNILGKAHAYDNAPVELAVVLAQLVSGVINASREEILSRPFQGKMETV
ncbi:hypothetical protein FSARC_1155 [Fusarium sarcochroum]|uniref:GAF domain-containing protein n=1 Tax=Fusarium sarcochroum TaxID=1208366 RepID=A0A8H4XEK3_9HYPO|nr:hypothetical protein FSARC_1155 [Fusarium sarcochroum]